MIEDFRRRQDDEDVVTDVCIIGAGAAGITIASALAGSDLRCCVLESGGIDFEADIQSLADVEQSGVNDGRACRLRYFGGSTNHWGGWCAPLNPVDFEARPWVPHSGWPIDSGELDSYYAAAQAICGLGPFGYAIDDLSGDSREFRKFHSAKVTTRFYHFSSPPTRFGTAYATALRNAGNVRVLLNANVTHLEANDDASAVEAARVRTLDGATGRVQARHFVVACGAIENARLLMLSNATEKQGLGNGNGLVGRYFMQHPHVPCASVLTTDRAQAARLFEIFQKGSFNVRASIGPSAAQQRKNQILNCSATVDDTPDPATGYGALRHIWRDIRRGDWPSELGEKLRAVISDLDSMTSGPKWMTLYMRSEQAPNPDSRVALGETSDRLGLRKAAVNWQLADVDKRTVLVASRLIGEEFARSGIGRVRLPDWLTAADASWPRELWGGCHHMGTTRMSDSPKTGVVDRNCRMQTVRNAFIAGSSVFPTCGYANPTLTIVALAVRLADHLKTLYR